MESPIPKNRESDYYDLIIDSLAEAQAEVPKDSGVYFLQYKRKVEARLE